MKRIAVVLVMLLALMTASAVYAASDVQKSVVVGSFMPTDENATSFEFRLAQPDVAGSAWGSEASFGYLTGVKAFNQDTDWKRYGLTLGRTYTKSIFTVSGGAGVFIEHNTSTDGYGGFYGGVKANLTDNLFVDAKYTEVIDGATSGWQFGVGVSF